MSLNYELIRNHLIELQNIINTQTQKTANQTKILLKDIKLFLTNSNFNFDINNYFKYKSEQFLLQKKRTLMYPYIINKSFEDIKAQREININFDGINKKIDEIDYSKSTSLIQAKLISKLEEIKNSQCSESMLNEIEKLYNKLKALNKGDTNNNLINNNNFNNTNIQNNYFFNFINNENNEIENNEKIAKLGIAPLSNCNKVKVLKNNKIVYADANLVDNISSARLKRLKDRKIKGKRRSIYRGVSKNGNQWQVLMVHNKSKSYIGSYCSEEIAGRVYDILAIKKKGIKAKTNFIYNDEQFKKIGESNFDIKSKNIHEIIDSLLN